MDWLIIGVVLAAVTAVAGYWRWKQEAAEKEEQRIQAERDVLKRLADDRRRAIQEIENARADAAKAEWRVLVAPPKPVPASPKQPKPFIRPTAKKPLPARPATPRGVPPRMDKGPIPPQQ